MALSRVSFWSSAVLHGALLGALAIGGSSAARRTRTLPPLVTIDCSDPQPPADEAPPPCEVPATQIEPALRDEVPIDTAEIVEPEMPMPAAAPTTTAAPRERLLPRQLESTFAAMRLRTAPPPMPPPPMSVPPSVVQPPADTDAARILTPLPGHNPPPEYPVVARRRGWQGTVIVAVTCDANGMVTTATVVRSSGHEVLDAAALATVRRWQFVGGPGCSEQPIEFRLRATGDATDGAD